jgi:predicted anti-sigma-YlaC factor YlaD
MSQARIRCVEFVELVTDWMELALDDDGRTEVEEHLAICPNCTAYLDQVRQTVALLRHTPEEAPPAAAREALLAVFRERRP